MTDKKMTLKGHVVHAWGNEMRLVVDGWVKMSLPSELQVPEGTEVEVIIRVTHVPDEYEIREFKQRAK